MLLEDNMGVIILETDAYKYGGPVMIVWGIVMILEIYACKYGGLVMIVWETCHDSMGELS